MWPCRWCEGASRPGSWPTRRFKTVTKKSVSADISQRSPEKGHLPRVPGRGRTSRCLLRLGLDRLQKRTNHHRNARSHGVALTQDGVQDSNSNCIVLSCGTLRTCMCPRKHLDSCHWQRMSGCKREVNCWDTRRLQVATFGHEQPLCTSKGSAK